LRGQSRFTSDAPGSWPSRWEFLWDSSAVQLAEPRDLATRLFLPGALAAADSWGTEDVLESQLESSIYDALYEDAPGGFQRAIEYGEKYVGKNNANVRVWVYLAAAYGQASKWARERDQNDPALPALRQKALTAVTKALPDGGRRWRRPGWDFRQRWPRPSGTERPSRCPWPAAGETQSSG